MRGQRLFIRPVESPDHEVVAAFLRTLDPSATAPTVGLIGKLVGNLVAVVGMQITADAIRITEIVVTPDLRRKRIGRLMLDEVVQLAVKIERNRIVMNECPEAEGFLRRMGFEREGAEWIREVRT